MKRFLLLLGLTLTMVLTACGGGGGSSGTNVLNNSGGTTVTSTVTTTVTAVASELIVVFDKASLNNSGSDRVIMDVTTVNSAGNTLAGVTVSVVVDNGAVFAGNTASVNGAFVTDGSGIFRGFITSPSNKTNRQINVTIASGNSVKTATIAVVGSKITVTPVPGAPVVNSPVTLNLRLVDANNNGIPNVNLTLSGSAGFNGAVPTDSNGNAIFNGIAPASVGAYSVNVSGSGVSVPSQIIVTSPTGGGIPDAVGPIGPGSLTANPNTVRNNLTAASNNRARVVFKVLNASNLGVQNVRVRFQILPPGLGAGESMSTGSSIVYTDAAGEVSSDYIPGTRSSPTDGVKIRACYGLTDAAVSSCSTFVDSELTVTGQPLNLSIFNNNTLAPRFNNTVYVQTLVIQVGDSAGQPVSGAVISASVDTTHFGKGPSWASPYRAPSVVAPTRADTYSTTLSDSFVPTSPVTVGSLTVAGLNVWCINEDLNRNGTRDAGEDLDADGVLEPRASDVIIQTPNGNVTDVNGQLLLDVTWGQNVGGWLSYTVKATTNVDGSEGSNSRAFITGVLQGDVVNGAFLTPPYGVNSCRTNN